MKEIISTKTAKLVMGTAIIGGIASLIVVPLALGTDLDDKPIAYNRNANSGAFESWVEKALLVNTDFGYNFSTTTFEVESNSAMERRVVEADGSLGYVSAGSVIFPQDETEPPVHNLDGINVLGLELTADEAIEVNTALTDAGFASEATYSQGSIIYPTMMNLQAQAYQHQRPFSMLWRGKGADEQGNQENDGLINQVDAKAILEDGDGNVFIEMINNGKLNATTQEGRDELVAMTYMHFLQHGISAEEAMMESGALNNVDNSKVPGEDLGSAGVINDTPDTVYVAILEAIENNAAGNMQDVAFTTQGSTSVAVAHSSVAARFGEMANENGISLSKDNNYKEGAASYVGFLNNAGHNGSGDALKADQGDRGDSYIGFQSKYKPTDASKQWTELETYGSFALDAMIMIANEGGFEDWDFTVTTEEIQRIFLSDATVDSDVENNKKFETITISELSENK